MPTKLEPRRRPDLTQRITAFTEAAFVSLALIFFIVIAVHYAMMTPKMCATHDGDIEQCGFYGDTVGDLPN